MKSLTAFFVPMQIVQDANDVRQGNITVLVHDGQPSEVFNERLVPQSFSVIQLSNAYTLTDADQSALFDVAVISLENPGLQSHYLVVINSQNEIQGIIRSAEVKRLLDTIKGSLNLAENKRKTFGAADGPSGLPRVDVRAYICPNHPQVEPFFAYLNDTSIPRCRIGGEERILRATSSPSPQIPITRKRLSFLTRLRKLIFGTS